MTDLVSATAGETVVPPGYLLPPKGPTQPSSDLGKDEFLQLLVAQLKHQDPLEPTSSDDFIGTSAQFTVIEKLDELAKQGANTAVINALATASSLFGREVVATGPDGPITAVVQRSQLVGGRVSLVTDKGPITLESITEVGPAPTPATQPPATPTPSPSTGDAQ